jgi:hypothetical protein
MGFEKGPQLFGDGIGVGIPVVGLLRETALANALQKLWHAWIE